MRFTALKAMNPHVLPRDFSFSLNAKYKLQREKSPERLWWHWGPDTSQSPGTAPAPKFLSMDSVMILGYLGVFRLCSKLHGWSLGWIISILPFSFQGREKLYLVFLCHSGCNRIKAMKHNDKKTSALSQNFDFFNITRAKSSSKNNQIMMIKIWDDLLPE